jgi:hypothetical protein
MITNEPLELHIWNMVQIHIVPMATNSVRNIVYKSIITNMATM